METLHIRVLHWPPRFNVHQVDLPLYPPRQKMPARKLWPVVAANRFRDSSLRHNPLQLPRHSPACKTGVHFQRQTFPCVHVNDAQHAKFPPALCSIVHKIQRPLLVRSRHRRSHFSSSFNCNRRYPHRGFSRAASTSRSRSASVFLLTPSSRPTSAALRPASICFSAPIISTSLYFLFAIPPPLRKPRKSYTLLRGFWGAGQES